MLETAVLRRFSHGNQSKNAGKVFGSRTTRSFWGNSLTVMCASPFLKRKCGLFWMKAHYGNVGLCYFRWTLSHSLSHSWTTSVSEKSLMLNPKFFAASRCLRQYGCHSFRKGSHAFPTASSLHFSPVAQMIWLHFSFGRCVNRSFLSKRAVSVNSLTPREYSCTWFFDNWDHTSSQASPRFVECLCIQPHDPSTSLKVFQRNLVLSIHPW